MLRFHADELTARLEAHDYALIFRTGVQERTIQKRMCSSRVETRLAMHWALAGRIGLKQ